MGYEPSTGMNVKGKNDEPSFGFMTANGRAINVSNKALLKAKELYTQVLKEIDNHEETFKTQTNESNGQVSNAKFRTMDDGQVNTSNEVSFKIKDFPKKTVANSQYVASSFGFKSASGRSISISDGALSKAKQQFEDDLEKEISKSDAHVVNSKLRIDDDQHTALAKQTLRKREISPRETVKNTKNVKLLMGFQTAGGSSISISDEALSKAKQQFEDGLEKEISESDTHVVNSKLWIGGGQHIALAKQTLQKREISARETVKNTKNLKLSMGFQTAGGSSISISDEALSKAKQQFEDDLEKEISESDTHVVNSKLRIGDAQHPALGKQALQNRELSSRETVKNTKNIVFSIGFKTAGGSSINISDKALSKAMQQYKNDVEKEANQSNISVINNEFQTVDIQHLATINETLQEAEMLLPEKAIQKPKNVISSVGFKTANDNSITVSEKVLLNAKHLFMNDLENTEKSKEIFTNGRSTIKPETQVENLGFQTASGHSVTFTEEALLKAKALYYKETSEDFENSVLLTKSLQKRKVKDLDDDVPSNKQTTSNQFKKLRFSNEFEIEKSSCKVSKNSQGKESQIESSVTTKFLSLNNGPSYQLGDNMDKASTSKRDDMDNSLISHEIVESTVALLADETNLNIYEQWISPVASKETEEAANIPSSPVLGGQFVPKKRKSVGSRKKSINTLKKEQDKSVSTHNLKELNDINSDKCMEKQSESLVERQELTNIEKKSETFISNEFGDSQLMLDFINESANILEKRLEAALEQDKQISLKKKYRPRPTISKLYFRRKSNRNNRVSWKEISKGNSPILCTYEELIDRKLPPEILNITADNAIIYKFRCTDFYGQDIVQSNIEGIQLEDGGCLILDENGYVGISEIKRSFLASPGVDPNLLPAGWVENHYKWIVWKLASMDRVKFGSITLPRALTPAGVMMELKYRYDREIDRSERPALRKILEKDDVASKRMVLCVSSISEHDDSVTANKSPNQVKHPSKKLILTDGWYSVQASVDQPMIRHIVSGKVKEGTKLMTYGSELLNCDQGCSPLEVLGNVCLKIHTNSTRRAKWDAKLGYVAPIGPMCVKLGSICSNGGLIGQVKVSIARVYPILYYQKTSDGESIYRNARCEEKANIAYEKECRSMIEAFYAETEKYFSAETRKSTSKPDSIDLAAIEWNDDREKLSREEFLSKQEQEQLISNCRMKEEKFRQKLESRLQKSLPPPRQVTPVLKIRVVEVETSAILSVWSPNEEITDILKEGNFISICNVMPSGRRGNELQLTANRNTVFNRINISNMVYPLRTCTALPDVYKSIFAPAYGEFDTVGLVVSVGSEPYGMKNFQAAYLAYPNTNSQSSYLSVLFWHGISAHGYAEILTAGSFVACSNLEWRRATSWNVPMAYCTERSTFTRNPRQNHLQQPFEDLKRLITDIDTYVTTCAEEISEEVKKKSATRMSDQYTPNKTLCSDRFNADKSVGNSTPQELSTRNLMSNQSTARSIAIQRRLEKLQYYGEPSSLSPIVLNNSSKRVSLDFQSPVRSSNTEQTKANVSLSEKFSQNSG